VSAGSLWPCEAGAQEKAAIQESQASSTSAESLFDGKALGNWKRTDFGGGGEAYVENGVIMVDSGEELSGVHWTKSVPRENYEFELEAQRRSGLDFFCGVTFPVGKNHLSLILGGWGGATVGISSINGRDASMNETTLIRTFTDFRWYKIRIRVEPTRVQAWLDEEQIADVDTQGKTLGLRAGEIELSRPLGVATFRTGAAFRGLVLRGLPVEKGSR
jgi:hypothetical protein